MVLQVVIRQWGLEFDRGHFEHFGFYFLLANHRLQYLMCVHQLLDRRCGLIIQLGTLDFSLCSGRVKLLPVATKFRDHADAL